MGKNDHDAIRAVLAGDKDAYGELVVRHSASLFRVAFRMTGNEADADDVVQDAFLRGYRKLASFESRASFSTWIYRIAVRCALDKMERRKAQAASRVAEEADPEAQEVQVMDESAGPERLLLSAEMAVVRQKAMTALTPTEQTAFVLRHMEDRTTEEISVVLGIQPNAAKQAVYRAVQKLRQRLAPMRVNA